MQKRLYRNNNDKILGGVSTGMADYLSWPVLLVRVLWLLIVFIAYVMGYAFWVIVVYLILWLALRIKPQNEIIDPAISPVSEPKAPMQTNNKMRWSFLFIRFIVIGCLGGAVVGWYFGEFNGFNKGESIIKFLLSVFGFGAGAIVGGIAFMFYTWRSDQKKYK